MSKLAALRIERRRVSVAVLQNERLDYAASRDLPSLLPKALESACAYVDWIVRNFTLYGIALEKNGSDPETWRSQITEEIRRQLREAGVPIFEAKTAAVISSFGHPPLKYRKELQEVASTIWPMLSSKEKNLGCLDAASLGLYVQVQHQFRSNK